MTPKWPKMVQKWPKKLRGCPQKSQTRGQTRTLYSSRQDSRQRDVPVYTGCLCQWAVCASGLSGQVRPFRGVYSGASAPPGPRRGARDAPPGCRSLPGTNLTASQTGPRGPFVAKFGVHLGKTVPCRAWGRVWYSGGSKKKVPCRTWGSVG